jgi:hypothetical protein
LVDAVYSKRYFTKKNLSMYFTILNIQKKNLKFQNNITVSIKIIYWKMYIEIYEYNISLSLILRLGLFF